jgi:small subunit ribosomal protein S16
MLKIILTRKGKKNQPFFRLIVLEKSKDPHGDFLEDLGYYNPLTKKNSLKEERIKYWISQGAQPSGSVQNLIINQGIIKGEKVKVTRKKIKEEEKGKEEKSSQPEEKKTEPLKESPLKDKEEKSEEKKEKSEVKEAKLEEEKSGVDK